MNFFSVHGRQAEPAHCSGEETEAEWLRSSRSKGLRWFGNPGLSDAPLTPPPPWPGSAHAVPHPM